MGSEERTFLLNFRVITHSCIADVATVCALFLHTEIHSDAYTYLVIKDVAAFLSALFTTGAGVALQINDPDFIELACHNFAKAIEGTTVNE